MQSKVVTSIRENIFGVYWRMPEMKCSFWFWHLIMRIAEFIRDSEWLSKSWVYFRLFSGIPKWLSELMAAIDRLTWMYFVLWRFSLTDFSLRRAQCVFFFASSSCSCCSREKSNKAPFKTTSRHPIDFHILAETQLCGTNKTQFTHRTRQIERKSKQIDRERATQIIDSAMSLVVWESTQPICGFERKLCDYFTFLFG